mgnify:CR=1 FL=1
MLRRCFGEERAFDGYRQCNGFLQFVVEASYLLERVLPPLAAESSFSYFAIRLSIKPMTNDAKLKAEEPSKSPSDGTQREKT